MASSSKSKKQKDTLAIRSLGENKLTIKPGIGIVLTGPNGFSNILGAPDKQGKLAVLGGDHGEVTEIARGMANGRVSFGFMSGQQILIILGDEEEEGSEEHSWPPPPFSVPFQPKPKCQDNKDSRKTSQDQKKKVSDAESSRLFNDLMDSLMEDTPWVDRNTKSSSSKKASPAAKSASSSSSEEMPPLIPGDEKVCWNCGVRGVRLLRCGGCEEALYCGKRCQVQHRRWHRPSCHNTNTGRQEVDRG